MVLNTDTIFLVKFTFIDWIYQTANHLSRAGLSRPIVVPAKNALFLQKGFHCHLTAMPLVAYNTHSGGKFNNFSINILSFNIKLKLMNFVYF